MNDSETTPNGEPTPQSPQTPEASAELPALRAERPNTGRRRFDLLRSRLRQSVGPLTFVLATIIGLQLYGWALDRQAAKTLTQQSAALDILNQELSGLRGELGRTKEALAVAQMGRADLERLASDVHSGWDEITLIEAERLVSLAASQLKVAGNVAAAIRALQLADARLARARQVSRAPWFGLRRKLAQDIIQLSVLAQIDVTGNALQLDDIALGVDSWPMLADATVPLGQPDEALSMAQQSAGAPVNGAQAENFWAKLRRGLRQEVDDWIRVRRVEGPESLLLTQTEQQLVRQQLRLRLLDARLALIAHNEELYQRELAQARALLTRYFDGQHQQVSAALAAIDALARNAQSVAIPKNALDETLAALQSALAQARQQT